MSAIADASRDNLLAVQNDVTREFGLLKWGFFSSWAENLEDTPRPINACSETVAEKSKFLEVFDQHRCLLPAERFYEWK